MIVYSPRGAGLLTGAFSAERAANLVLDEKDLAEITAAVTSSGAGTGPARPA